MSGWTRITTALILASALAGLAACGGGGGNGVTSSSGMAVLQGQVLREPTVTVSVIREWLPGWMRTAVAVPEAWGAGPQPVPVPNMMVDLTINGRSMGSTTTDGAGRFRFNGMPSGMYELRIHDASGRYTFTYSMNMGTGQTMAVYCVMWGSGSDVSETCTQQAGDHWNDMMQGVPAGHWDTEHHGWMAGPSGMM